VAQRVGKQSANLRAENVQVIDVTGAPRLLATVTQVTRTISRPETGTVFLLGDQGLTVIRRIDVERQYAQQEASKRGN
jgi:hypothetical protein